MQPLKQWKPETPMVKHSSAQADYPEYTWIGTVVAAHGIKGELKIRPLTDFPEYYQHQEVLHLELQGRLQPYSAKALRIHKQMWIALVEGVSDRNQAEELKDCRVFLEDELLRPLDEDEFFVHELIGCRVESLQGDQYGELMDVMETGANDVYVVRRETKEWLVPAVNDVVKRIDVEQRLIVIDPPAGMMD